jgi:hypothetical protein
LRFDGEENSVRGLDYYFPYSLAVQLHDALAAYPVGGIFPMSCGSDALGKFIAVFDESFLPKSKEKAKGIKATLDSVIDLLVRSTGKLTVDQHAALTAEIVEFEEELQKECKGLYVLCVQDQRLLSAYVLVEHIEIAVSPKTWKYMSKLARQEIEESGKCLALERYTASGFHILRCLESVIREYVTALVGVPTKRDWGYYLQVLKDNGARNEVTSIVDNMRQDDRNPLMHPEKFLNMDEAIGLFNLSQTALDRLVSDMEKRGFAKFFAP